MRCWRAKLIERRSILFFWPRRRSIDERIEKDLRLAILLPIREKGRKEKET